MIVNKHGSLEGTKKLAYAAKVEVKDFNGKIEFEQENIEQAKQPQITQKNAEDFSAHLKSSQEKWIYTQLTEVWKQQEFVGKHPFEEEMKE